MKKEIPSKPEIEIRKFINPLTDFGFKCLFGNPEGEELLIDLLNTLLRGRKVITGLTFNKNEKLGPRPQSRNMIFDLICTGPGGEQFIIEIQRIRQQFFRDRAIYYVSRLINDQAPKGRKWDYSLKEVYFIGLMDFNFDDSNEREYLHPVVLAYEKTGELFYEKLKYFFIEIPKFKKSEKQLKSRLDKWMFVLKNLSRLEKIPLILRDKIFLKLFKTAAVSNLTKEELMKYEEDLMAAWDEYAIKKTMEEEKKTMKEEKKALQEEKKVMLEEKRVMLAQGLQEGMEKGMEKGKKEGIAEGKAGVVKNLITKMGLSDKQAAEIAEVSLVFVKNIRQELKK